MNCFIKTDQKHAVFQVFRAGIVHKYQHFFSKNAYLWHLCHSRLKGRDGL